MSMRDSNTFAGLTTFSVALIYNNKNLVTSPSYRYGSI